MEQNAQEEKNNAEIKLDAEGEPIRSGSKKYLSKKIVILVLFLLIMAIAGCAYSLFFGGKDENQLFLEQNAEILKNKEAEEVEVDKSLDSDQDKLPDYLEKILGTSENNPDTDGDSYSDFDEIKNGYSPLTSEKYSAEEWEAIKGKIKTADEKFYGSVFGGVAAKPDFICGTDTVKDVDNNVYNTVKIGEQCWLKENMKVTKNPAGVAITRYCYDNDPGICDMDGGLYDWNTAMNNSTAESAQGICPNGWHVPKDSEWYVLENGLKDEGQTCDANRNSWDCDQAGTKLKVGGTSGFEGILAGYRKADGSFHNRLTSTNLWSSSQYDASSAWKRYLNSGHSTVNRYYYDKAYGFSVRCLKD